MRYSLDWIREYVDVKDDATVLAQRLTLAGLPVERLERIEPLPSTVVLGNVLETRRHPNADRLTLCRVEAGQGRVLDIVCGAPNVRPGMWSPVALVGTTLPNGVTIKQAKIRGETSEGMLCSAIELGLGQEADGIMDVPPGTPGGPYAGGPTADVIFDVDVPSNRGDALSHTGLAREIAALTGCDLRLPGDAFEETDPPASRAISVEVENAEDCPRFTAHVLRDVRIGSSPEWLVRRLESVGLRSINNVVDVTNFVLLETGQPLHAFDLDRLGTGRILVRRARPGERLRTLDGVERNLTGEVLCITDGKRPIAAAGIMGGADTEVVEETKNVLLEAAWFRPGRVLKGSRELRLDTEASLRFRRGVDPGGVLRAARRAVALLAEVAGARAAKGCIEAADAALLEARSVSLRPARIGAVIGDPVEEKEASERLRSLGFETAAKGATWAVRVPSWRLDVLEECDLIEEVARHRGYDAIGVREYNGSGVKAPLQPEEGRLRKLGEVLRGLGFQEALTRTLVSSGDALRAGLRGSPEARFFRILDPPSREEEGLRLSLVPSLLAALSHNLRHGQHEVRLYEIGKTFAAKEGDALPDETSWIGLAATGGEFPPSLEKTPRRFGFLEFKGVVEGLLAVFSIDRPKWRTYNALDFSPENALEGCVEDTQVGFLADVNAPVRARWDLGRPVFVAQLRLDAFPLDTGLPARYREPSRFPAARRDLALIVPAGASHDDVRSWIRDEAGRNLAEIELFDRYQGKHIPEGHVGFGFRLTFRAPDRTLEEQEVDAAVDRIVAGLTRRGIVRREA